MWGNNNVSRKNVFRPPGRVFTMESWSQMGYCDYCSDFSMVIRLINALPERLSCAQAFQGEWFPAFWGQYVVCRVKRITLLALEWPPVFYSSFKMKVMSQKKTCFLAQADAGFAIAMADGYTYIWATLSLKYRPNGLKLVSVYAWRKNWSLFQLGAYGVHVIALEYALYYQKLILLIM